MTIKRIAALAVVPLLSVSSFTLAQEEKLEEIVVTGSYIKGTPGDSALPVQVLDRSFIEGIGAKLRCRCYCQPSHQLWGRKSDGFIYTGLHSRNRKYQSSRPRLEFYVSTY